MTAELLNRYRRLIHKLRSWHLLAILVLPFVFITASCETSDPGDTPMFSRSKMLGLVNNARQNGRNCGKKWYPPVSKLQWNDKLEAAAKEHSNDMFQNNFFSHKGSDGMTVDNRLYTQHYFWKTCGENVAYGMLYEDELMKELLASEGHCANIMNPYFTQMGAWVTGLYWTQVFAKPDK
jgi:uncharacterized protein YkwD